jgi:uncharacterized protein (UPF0128 family)
LQKNSVRAESMCNILIFFYRNAPLKEVTHDRRSASDAVRAGRVLPMAEEVPGDEEKSVALTYSGLPYPVRDLLRDARQVAAPLAT